MIEEDRQRIKNNALAAISMFAKVENQQLDFDEQSVAIVDAFINQRVGVFEDTMLSQLVSVVGSFVGECIRKNFGGDWDLIDGELGIRFDQNNVAFPFSKVRRQFKNGREDSVLSFYQVIPIVFQIK